MDHNELGGNFTTKTVEYSRTQPLNIHKSKNKIMWKFPTEMPTTIIHILNHYWPP